MVRPASAAERMNIGRVLGHDVLKAADAIQAELTTYGKARAASWRTLLQALMDGAGDAMSSPVGMSIQLAILGKIQGAKDANDDGASERQSGRPGAGFPGNRRG
jgi:hypothetical protein